MKVCVYQGSLGIVEKSGVGQAIHHQEEALRRAGAELANESVLGADVVHVNTVFPDSVRAAIRAKAFGSLVVCYGHSTMEDFRNSFKLSNLAAPPFRRWIEFCYTRGDVIITPTPYSKGLLESYGIETPIYALSNGVDTDRFYGSRERRAAFRRTYGLSESDKVVLSVGHMIERKGILEFIDLARSMPGVQFFWFGRTSRALMTAEVAQAIDHKPDNLEFPGFVSQEEMREAYAGCDLFCFMSKEETEGIVVLEALASGVPVLVRDIPVYDGWLQSGENVWKASTQAEFGAAARRVLSGEAPNLTGAGRRTAEERNLNAVGTRLLEIYDEALALRDAREETRRQGFFRRPSFRRLG